MAARGIGYKDRPLTEDEVRETIAATIDASNLRGKKIACIIPDSTRTCPLPMLFRIMCETVGAIASKLDFIIALGTHPPMTDEAINTMLKIPADERKTKFARFGIFNHRWDKQDELKHIGTISESEVEHISHCLLKEDVRVEINSRIFEYDQLIIVGPTFPHEVVGFSGGNKYFFPGISGPEVLNFFHWLGAMMTIPVIIGQKRTPVRQVVDKAASFIPLPKLCFSLVIHHSEIYGLYAGAPEDAYDSAAELSSALHVTFVEKQFKRVLSCAPKMYDDVWTAGKCMYKLEPALAEGADLIIYAPHIDEVSYTHGKMLDKVGYHVRDYFRTRMSQFTDVPRGVLAHSTHVKGIGTFKDGIERPRVNVILATRIPEARCKQINLGYMDPDSIKHEEWQGREAEGIVHIPKAGETLYRLADGTVPRIPGDNGYQL